MRTRLVALIALILVGLLTIWILFAFLNKSEIAFHGFVQGDLVFVGAEEGGRLAKILATEGQEVKSGDPLFLLDDTLAKAARDEAKASLLEARLQYIKASSARMPPEEVEVLKAKERKAEAALRLSERELDRAESAPTSVRDRARAKRDIDRATLDEVRRQIAVAEMSARVEDVEVARARISAVKARLEAAQSRLDQRHVIAPSNGIIRRVYFRTGEIVPPGRPVVSLLPLKNILVRFFVGEALLQKLAVGDTVVVRCDGCDAPINARIRFISPTAEFTPPIIYSNEERSRLVFMMEAIPELPRKLRPGQPVTVYLSNTKAFDTRESGIMQSIKGWLRI